MSRAFIFIMLSAASCFAAFSDTIHLGSHKVFITVSDSNGFKFTSNPCSGYFFFKYAQYTPPPRGSSVTITHDSTFSCSLFVFTGDYSRQKLDSSAIPCDSLQYLDYNLAQKTLEDSLSFMWVYPLYAKRSASAPAQYLDQVLRLFLKSNADSSIVVLSRSVIVPTAVSSSMSARHKEEKVKYQYFDMLGHLLVQNRNTAVPIVLMDKKSGQCHLGFTSRSGLAASSD